MEIVDCVQGTPEWFAARLGIPTASMFATVMASGRGGGESKTRATYMAKLAGEIITGEPAESFSNSHTERGNAQEGEARNLYSFTRDVEPQLVGFIRNGKKGASPDSLIGADGALEIKCRLPHIQIETLFADKVPSENVAQCQGVLWVSEREWIDYISYSPKMPLFVKRLYRDEDYIARLSEHVDMFNAELHRLVERVRSYG